MDAHERVSEIRPLGEFERISLRTQHDNELVILQGPAASLTIDAPAAVLSRIVSSIRDGRLEIRLSGGWGERVRDAVSTSLSRARIKYYLTVQSLSELEIAGIAHVHVPSLWVERFALRLIAPGQVRIESLEAESLDVTSRSPCRFVLAGRVDQQHVTLDGPGHYDAANLESRATHIVLRGIANATVWAIEGLEATIRGPGTISYYGSPRVVSHVAPLGSLMPLGER